MTNKQRRRHRLGAATVEVAFTLPIMLLFIFGGWEFCCVNAIQNTIENAAYEAARESMLPGATQARVEAAADNVLNTMVIQNRTITMTPSVLTPTTADVTITISVPVADNSMGFTKFFTSGNLSTTLTFAREIQPGQF